MRLTLILFLVGLRCCATTNKSDDAAAADDDAFEDDLYSQVYRRCWSACRTPENGSDADPFVGIMKANFDLQAHKLYCGRYNETRACATKCLTRDDHLFYLRPFFRRNYLNEFICHKHYHELREYLPCYLRNRAFETIFEKCGDFVFGDEVHANRETCGALQCVTQSLPTAARSKCVADDGVAFANAAANLLEKMLAAFLRQRVRLHKMTRLCEQFYRT